MSTPQPTETPRPLFFSISSAKYSIEPGATPRDLIADAALLLGSGSAALMSTMESLTEAQWAGLYLMQQAHSLVQHAAMLLEQDSSEGEA